MLYGRTLKNQDAVHKKLIIWFLYQAAFPFLSLLASLFPLFSTRDPIIMYDWSQTKTDRRQKINQMSNHAQTRAHAKHQHEFVNTNFDCIRPLPIILSSSSSRGGHIFFDQQWCFLIVHILPCRSERYLLHRHQHLSFAPPFCFWWALLFVFFLFPLSPHGEMRYYVLPPSRPTTKTDVSTHSFFNLSVIRSVLNAIYLLINYTNRMSIFCAWGCSRLVVGIGTRLAY